MQSHPHKDRTRAIRYTGVWRELEAATKRARDRMDSDPHFPRHLSCLDEFLRTELEIQKQAMRHTDMRTTMIYGGVSDAKVDQVLRQVSDLVFTNSTRNRTRGS